MKILFVSSTYPTPVQPRQGAFNQVLVTALRAQHEVHVIAPIPWTQHRALQRPISGPAQDHHPLYFFPPKLLRHHYGIWYWLSIRRTVHRLAASFSPDAVLGYWLHPDGYAATQAARLLNAPAVVMSGGTDLRLLTQSCQRREKIQQVLRQADRVVVVCRDLAEHALRLGANESKIDIVYRGIDRGCFHPADRAAARRELGIPAEAKVLLWVGRFEPVKNPQLLLSATQLWQQKWRQKLQLFMIGDGSLRNDIARQAARLKLLDNLHIIPALSQSRLARYYQAADATVLTSHSEGIPNVLLESISCGTPFVATHVGGVAEIASPGIDYLVPVNDAEFLAQATIDCIEQVDSTQRTFVPLDKTQMASEIENSLFRAILGRREGKSHLRPGDAA